jgi:hypothetical protein
MDSNIDKDAGFSKTGRLWLSGSAGDESIGDEEMGGDYGDPPSPLDNYGSGFLYQTG